MSTKIVVGQNRAGCLFSLCLLFYNLPHYTQPNILDMLGLVQPTHRYCVHKCSLIMSLTHYNQLIHSS